MSKQKLISMLEEIIEAGQEAEAPLEMENWYAHNKSIGCGYSCCLIGDLAIKKYGITDMTHYSSLNLSNIIDDLCCGLFEDSYLVESMYSSYSNDRLSYAKKSELLTKKELNHKHLTTDHHDRTIAHDYIRLVIRKVKDV